MGILLIYTHTHTHIYIYNIASQLLACSQYVVLAGDINVDLLKAQKCSDYLIYFQLVHLIQGPSKVSLLSSALINQIRTVLLKSYFSVLIYILKAIGVSDHHVQITEFDVPVCWKVSEFFVWSYRLCCWKDIQSCLSEAFLACNTIV